MLLSVACMPALAQSLPAPTPQSADRVVVFKAARTLYVYRHGLVIQQYNIALGRQPIGAKHSQGDERTPEGHYVLDWRNPHSHFYRSIHISYPAARDRRRAARRGVNPGGEIMIHGQPAYDDIPRHGDWTDGCIAISDKGMDQLWQLIAQNTPIDIYP